MYVRIINGSTTVRLATHLLIGIVMHFTFNLLLIIFELNFI